MDTSGAKPWTLPAAGATRHAQNTRRAMKKPCPPGFAEDVDKSAVASLLGIYIHIPFCSAICNYCNFNRGLLDEGLKRRYLDALEHEIRQWRAFCPLFESRIPSPSSQLPAPSSRLPADTIYFGGGTPSLLSPAEVARLVAACRETFDLQSDVEITLEANPETVSLEHLAGYRAAGVNRLSFGVQSFRDEELRRLGRLHTADRAREAVALARAAGFTNLSLDLMMWLPGQTVGDWQASVEALIALGPEHVSFYLLELYPNAPLREEMARAGWSQAPDDDAATMYLVALDLLGTAGYDQYEISNAARGRRRSRHNLKYWTDGAWLGFGCGAHATFGGARWRNVSGAAEYVARLRSGDTPVVDTRVLSETERFQDALFTGLRLTDGLDVAAVGARYGRDVRAEYGSALEPFVDAGLVQRDGDWLRLTRRGMLLANEVMSTFV